MKQQWQRLAAKVDALTLRERVMIFASAVAVLLFVFYAAFLNPQYLKQKQLTDQLSSDQVDMGKARDEIQKKTQSLQLDPDADDKAKLAQLQAQIKNLKSAIETNQKTLVPADKMAAVLEEVLKGNGRLKLVSLRNLPVIPLSDMASPKPADAKPGTASAVQPDNKAKTDADAKGQGKTPDDPVFSHRVEITVRGSYPDLLNYLEQLEGMAWHLNWSSAQMDVDEQGMPTLTLVLYTLSLDKKWLDL